MTELFDKAWLFFYRLFVLSACVTTVYELDRMDKHNVERSNTLAAVIQERNALQERLNVCDAQNKEWASSKRSCLKVMEEIQDAWAVDRRTWSAEHCRNGRMP